MTWQELVPIVLSILTGIIATRFPVVGKYLQQLLDALRMPPAPQPPAPVDPNVPNLPSQPQPRPSLLDQLLGNRPILKAILDLVREKFEAKLAAQQISHGELQTLLQVREACEACEKKGGEVK